jgi:hypothetical protein
MFCSCSWPFPLLPSCLPIMPPDTVQVASDLSYYWDSKGGLTWGNGPEHILGHFRVPSGA